MPKITLIIIFYRLTVYTLKKSFNNLLTAFSTEKTGKKPRKIKGSPPFPHIYQHFYVENYVEYVNNLYIQRVQNLTEKFCKIDEEGRIFA